MLCYANDLSDVNTEHMIQPKKIIAQLMSLIIGTEFCSR